jgi:signal transduction histidine kinase
LFFKSLISRVILLNILLLATGIGIFSLFIIREEQRHLVDATRESAEMLLSTVERSIYNSMRIGNSEDVQAILEMVGRGHQLHSIRIFHPDGTILKSAKAWEIGTRASSYDLSLFINNRSEGIFRVDGEEVLGMVKPIVSDERCYRCHGIGRKVLGVLNLHFSLDSATEKLAETSTVFMLSTAVLIALLSAGVSFILLRFVRTPIQTMAAKMEEVEAGDLSVRLSPRYQDEIGSLMRSFNSMVVNMEKAKKELEYCHYQQMERADRLASVGEMATGIAHEIKNPLAGISGAISVLADDFAEGDPRKEIIRQILEQIARLDKTSTDLLFFGRPGKPEFSHVNINALINNTLFFVAQHPEARNIHRVKELTRDLPPVLVDEKQIQQVLFNIIINAVQAMPEGGTLTVLTESRKEGGQEFVRVLICDTGKGIPPESLEKIFVPFYTTKTQGTGLGLPICKTLTQQNGGTLSVASRLGEGTTFIIELPAAGGQPTTGKEDNRA